MGDAEARERDDAAFDAWYGSLGEGDRFTHRSIWHAARASLRAEQERDDYCDICGGGQGLTVRPICVACEVAGADIAAAIEAARKEAREDGARDMASRASWALIDNASDPTTAIAEVQRVIGTAPADELDPPRLTPEIVERALKRGAENAKDLAKQLERVSMLRPESAGLMLRSAGTESLAASPPPTEPAAATDRAARVRALFERWKQEPDDDVVIAEVLRVAAPPTEPAAAPLTGAQLSERHGFEPLSHVEFRRNVERETRTASVEPAAARDVMGELREKVRALCAENFPGGVADAIERLKWLHARRCEAGQDRVLLAILRLLDSTPESEGERG